MNATETRTAPSSSASATYDADPLAVAHTWRGHPVRVRARLIPRTLYMTADITVEVNGEVVLHTGGQRAVTGTVKSEFVVAGVAHRVELVWRAGSAAGFPVDVRVDGDDVLVNEKVRISNPFMMLVGPLSIAGGLAVLVTLLDWLSR